MPKIQHIIFDLGGVVVDIDSERMRSSFENLSFSRDLFASSDFIHLSQKFEIGQMDRDEFCLSLRQLAGKYVENQAIWDAWNSLVVGLPQTRISTLLSLKSQYHIYALSNTNVEHISHINNLYLPSSSLESLFHKTYYSYELGLRKPNREFFEYALADMRADPCETLFIDDLEENLKPAADLGIQTILAKKNHFDFTSLLNELNSGLHHNRHRF